MQVCTYTHSLKALANFEIWFTEKYTSITIFTGILVCGNARDNVPGT